MALDFKNQQELIRKSRKEKNISLEEISEKLKVPKHILMELENEEDFFDRNYPYSLYLVKEISKLLDIENLEIKKETKEPVKIEENKNIFFKIKEKVLSLLKLSFLSLSIFLFLFLTYSFNQKENNINVFEFKQETKKDKEKNFLKKQEIYENKINTIKIVALKDLWLTAKIDGEEKVYKIKKNKKINLIFKNKIHFETIGNADGAILVFKNKKVKLGKNEIIHNIFIDKDGIFKNGYNLLEENS